MKKLLFSLSFAALGLTASAQIADGSVAPNFTATDLNGNSHTLQTYLDAGKSVILDISATWCTPCWDYHNTHALADFYNAYGPNGSDEVMVFYIEGDDQTTIADLNGTGGNTQGDWVIGTPYPIINSGSIADLYEITYFPTLYRICPNGLVYEINQLTAAQLKSNVNTNCGTLSGEQNHAEIKGSDLALCSTSGAATASIKNVGTNSITSATVLLKENGTQVASVPFTGNIAQFGSGNVTFPSYTFNLSANYTAELTAVNTVAPFNADLTTADIDVVSAEFTGLNITVKVYTDNYPSETSWEIRNSATNAVVASGGPYQAGTEDQFGAGGPDALTTKTHNVTLPAGNNCYKINVFDSFEDGMQYGSNPAGQFGVEVFSNGNSIVNLDLGNFGASTSRDAAMKTDATSGMVEGEAITFNVYPNPASDEVNISFEAENADYQVSIIDLQGREVAAQNHTSLTGSQVLTFPVAELAKGSYLVRISTNGVSQTRNVVVK